MGYGAYQQRILFKKRRQILVLQAITDGIGKLLPEPKKRALILMFPGEDGNWRVFTHHDETKFSLQRGEDALTAARFILKDYFKWVSGADLHRSKIFEYKKTDYHIIKYDAQSLPNHDGSDGFQEMIRAGFTIILLGDHPLSPKIKNAIKLP